MTKVLIVTNDFPPRSGGIQSFVHALAARLPADGVVVYAPAWDGAAEFDARQPFPVIRHPGSLMLPVPAVRAGRVALLAEHGCDTVLFGAAAPLGLLAPHAAQGRSRADRRAHARARGRLGRAAGCQVAAAAHRRRGGRAHLSRRVLPDPDGQGDVPGGRRPHGQAHARSGPGGVPAGRRRHAGPQRSRHPGRPACRRLRVPDGAAQGPGHADQGVASGTAPVGCDPLLLLVGDGPYRSEAGPPGQTRPAIADSVLFTGPVSWDDLPAYYDAGNIFAMPCRTRRAGLDVEGLGIVYLEASATGLPVIGGDSGGAPDAILDGETGYVVPGRDEEALARQLVELLARPSRRRRDGRQRPGLDRPRMDLGPGRGAPSSRSWPAKWADRVRLMPSGSEQPFSCPSCSGLVVPALSWCREPRCQRRSPSRPPLASP